MKKFKLIMHETMLLTLLLSVESIHAQHVEETLCDPHEEIYFSCPAKREIISVCASGNTSPQNGYVEYRMGKRGNIDFQYPEKSYPPLGRFSISDITGGNLNLVHLKFKSGGYDYVVYQGDVSGVYVKKKGKTVGNLICDVGNFQSINPRAMRGIKTSPPTDGID